MLSYPTQLSHVSDSPWVPLARLVAAGALGLLLVWVQGLRRKGQPMDSRSGLCRTPLEQALLLLCLGGGITVLVVGESLARAFGIAGAASIIRFRTPIESPRDAILLFLSLAVGMACGLGALWVAVVGVAFVCAAILWMDGGSRSGAKVWNLEVSASGGSNLADHVESVLVKSQAPFERRQVIAGPDAILKYRVVLQFGQSLEQLNSALLGGGASEVRSVSWAPQKR